MGRAGQYKPGQSGSPEKRFKTGNPGGPGRRPLLITEIRKRKGYERITMAQIIGVIEDMLVLTLEELQDVAQNPSSSVLVVTLASAIRKGIKDGDPSNIETIISRAFGRAQQKIQHEGIPDNKISVEIVQPKAMDEE